MHPVALFPFRRGGGLARWTRRAGLGVALTLAFAGCATPPAASRGSAWHETRIGLCEDYPEETRSRAAARADLRMAQQMGARVLRVALGWDAIEPARGHYDWKFWDDFVADAAVAGVRLAPYVCYTPRWAATEPGAGFWRSPPRDVADFRRFMAVVVRRYRGSIRTWELWNEPDNPAYWSGSAAELADLVRAGAAGVRAADPSARVVLGGIATDLDFLEALFRDQHLAPAVDVVNLHAYFETWHPEPIEALPEYVARAAEIVSAEGEAEPLWLAETGYSSVGHRRQVSDVYRAAFDHEHDEAAQAGAVARTLFLALGTQRLPVIAWYRINDLPPRTDVIGDDNNLHLGLRRADGRPKPAAQTLTEIGRLFRDAYRRVQLPLRVERAGAGAEPVVRAFALRDGRWVIAAWLRGSGSAPATERVRPDQRAATVHVGLPAGFRPGSLRRHRAGERAAESGELRWQEGGTEAVFQLRGGGVVWGVWSR